MNSKKITFLSIIYNTPIDQLTKCVDSIVEARNYSTDYEVILVDNASTDTEVYKTLVNKYSHFDYIRIEKTKENRVKASGIELAIPLINTEYFAVIDPDDYIDSNKVGKVIELLYKTNSNYYIFDFHKHDNVTNKIKYASNPKKSWSKQDNYEITIDDMPRHIWHFECNVIRKTKYFKDHFSLSKDINVYTDVTMDIVNISKAKNVCIVSDSYYFYRVNQGGKNLSSKDKFVKNYMDFYYIFKHGLQYYTKDSLNKKHLFYFLETQAIAYIFFGCAKVNKNKPWVLYKRIKRLIKEISPEFEKDLHWYSQLPIATLSGVKGINSIALYFLGKFRK